ncbi:hypothetical protein BASA50_007521 [Batrachochytrium salamandrivorans]|uniref:Cyclic nucleotide-binding domain-containing protein n=1 Tax=Batrachochytrium salamandrivorans TaxID=1357716 RepID=A0ABQ8F706_9FUNG|nr:hypothetical protein BASA62_008579 [Batrachochytrium salamandrivorans]KAH6593313.1 hypothetical protein BASA50_007521 [Batrachochytrium salamandrivorans]KAH9274216.1 hypothetical protein BASA83_003524 [Batrachochytrium salamandrivorans]
MSPPLTNLAISLKDHPAFLSLDAATLEKLSINMKQQEWTAGTTMISYGETGDSIFFLVSGSAQVLSEFDADCDIIQPGQWFGEVAPFQNVARTAFVKAKDACVTYTISKHILTEVLQGCPSLLEEINGTSKQRMQMYLERSILA